jgi:uncharacterized protein
MRIIIFVLLMLSTIVSAQDSDLGATKSLAEQGYADAQSNLGFMYDNGNGVPENDAEAVKWYRLAAEQGNADAQSNLGGMYYDGEGVPENYLAAYVWYSVSAAKGNQIAKNNIEIVKNVLTNEQLVQGQVLASKCFESNFKDCP